MLPTSKFQKDFEITNKTLKNVDLSCIVRVVLMFSDLVAA